MVTDVPHKYSVRVRRPQPIYIRHQTYGHAKSDIQSTCRRSDELRLESYGYGVCEWGLGPDSADLERGTGTQSGGVPHKTDAKVFDVASCIPSVLIIKSRVTSSIFTADARFVLSGSDDGNVRIWKGKASEKLGVVTARERAAIEYRNSLLERWKMDNEVGKVARARHLPKPVYTANKLKRTMLDSERVKEERRRKHTRAGDSKPKAERKKVVIVEQT